MSASVYAHDRDEISVTGFKAKITQTDRLSPPLYEAEFAQEEKQKYLAVGIGETVQAAVADLYRNYRDIRKQES